MSYLGRDLVWVLPIGGDGILPMVALWKGTEGRVAEKRR